MRMKYNGHPVIGFGQAELIVPAVASASPWPMVVATSVVSAVTGWAVEETVRAVKKRKRRR